MQQRSLTILSRFRRRIDCCDDTEVRIRNHWWQTSEIRDQKTMIYRINETDQNFIDRKKHKSFMILHVLNARKFSSDLHCSQNFYLESEIKKSDSNTIDAKIRAETEMMHNRCSNLWALSEKLNQNSRSIQYNKIWTIVTRQFHKWSLSRIEFSHDWWKNL